MKNPLTPAGIELATFRFVAQHLNHCATAVPTDTPDTPVISDTPVILDTPVISVTPVTSVATL